MNIPIEEKFLTKSAVNGAIVAPTLPVYLNKLKLEIS